MVRLIIKHERVKKISKRGGFMEESKSIKHHADKWCKDNNYPPNKRKRINSKKSYLSSNFILP